MEADGEPEEERMMYKRVVVSRLGGPEVLQLREEELPEPGLGEVRVRILATGVSLPHPDAQEVQTCVVSRGFERALRTASPGEDQADHRGANPAGGSCPRPRVARKGGGDGKGCAAL